MSIEQLKKILDSEREIEAEKYHGNERSNWGPDFKAGHESATNRLLPLLEKAVETFKKIEDPNSAMMLDKNRKQSFGDWELRLIAREFLSEFTKMTDIKKEGK